MIPVISTMYEMQSQISQVEEGCLNESLLYECTTLLGHLFTLMSSHMGVLASTNEAVPKLSLSHTHTHTHTCIHTHRHTHTHTQLVLTSRPDTLTSNAISGALRPDSRSATKFIFICYISGHTYKTVQNLDYATCGGGA